MTATHTKEIPFLPVAAEHDGALAEFAAFRLRGLRVVTELVHDRLAEPGQRALRDGLALAEALEPAHWVAVVTAPWYSWWWTQLCEALRRHDEPELCALAPHLPRLLVLASLRSGLLTDGVRLSLPPATGCGLRLPGSRRTVGTAFLPDAPLTVRVSGTDLVISDGATDVHIGHSELVGDHGADRPRLPGTAIEMDASDPWVLEYLDRENRTRPSPGRAIDDVTPAITTGAELSRLAHGLARIADSWPEMHREILDYVHLVVPFTSAVRSAFTNVSWQGAVFLRTSFDNEVADVERLTHETSHLRLNMLMCRNRLHEHSWSDQVASPFRAGMRPITGLYHGAFVVTRAASALDLVSRAGGGERFARRVPLLVGQVRLALRTLYRDVRLTPAGTDLLDQVRAQADHLADVHGVAEPPNPTIYTEV